MTTPLDDLAESVKLTLCMDCRGSGQSGKPRSFKSLAQLAPTDTLPLNACPRCNGSKAVLNVDDPVFEALWQVCPGCLERHKISTGHHCGWGSCFCDGKGIARRSHAEAALLLLEACPRITLHHARLPDRELHYPLGVNQWWIATFPCPNVSHDHRGISWWPAERTCIRGEATIWLEAVAAAVLAKMKEKG